MSSYRVPMPTATMTAMPKPLPPGSWNERALDRVRKARSLTARSTKTSQTSCKRGGPVGHALSPEALVSSPDLGCVVSRYTPCKKQLEDDSWKITSPDEKRPGARLSFDRPLTGARDENTRTLLLAICAPRRGTHPSHLVMYSLCPVTRRRATRHARPSARAHAEAATGRWHTARR